ncbi:MAG: hypothetical protein KF756_06730 [Acidobacteria bacterium]|nr:hypothetical protein [Acidobacteriota bacterium]
MFFRRTTSYFSILCLLAAIVSVGCGKRGLPRPPKEKVSQRAEVSGYQRGNTVKISWKMPARNAGKGSVLNIDRVDIYRLAEPIDAPRSLTAEDFASRSNIIKTLKIVDDDFGGKILSYTDELQFASQPVRLIYALRFANASGQKAAFSNFLVIEPAGRVASNPTSLQSALSQDAVTLSWTPPAANIDGTTPVSLLGYNVYRSTSEKEPARLLNKTPITQPEFRDEFFEFGKQYYYFVRSVSLGTGSDPVESTESNILVLKPVDTFAPSAPTAITLAVGQDLISIFFATNPEKDIKGYKIYRSTDKDLELSKWQLLTPELMDRNSFQDKAVESGKQYFYYITATDTAGNVSPPSEIVSEQMPVR